MSESNGHHPRDVIVVMGEVTRLCMAEYAELVLAVHAEGRNAVHALQENARIFEHLRKLAMPFGIGPTESQVAVLGVQPVLPPQAPVPSAQPPAFPGMPAPAPPQANAESQLPSYRVSSLVKLVLYDLNRVGEFIDALTQAGAFPTGGLAFRVRDESPARRIAFEEAMRVARIKAESLAAAAGRQLGPPIGIVEQTSGDPSALPAASRESLINVRLSVQYELR